MRRAKNRIDEGPLTTYIIAYASLRTPDLNDVLVTTCSVIKDSENVLYFLTFSFIT